jgi:hypothetical protein
LFLRITKDTCNSDCPCCSLCLYMENEKNSHYQQQ